MFLLPVSRAPVLFRSPDGHDELVLAEGGGSSASQRVDAVRRLAPPADRSIEWDALPYADVDAALLAWRQRMQGDRLLAEIRCGTCGAWGDTALSVHEYLEANRPRASPEVRAQEDGWWNWREVRFRPPSAAAVVDAVNTSGMNRNAVAGLIRFCCGADSPAILARINSLLKRMAPPLAGLVNGSCPQCGGRVHGWFDPGAFVLEELRSRAGILFDHVHLLAQAYGWTEGEILALSAKRRAAYALRIEQERLA